MAKILGTLIQRFPDARLELSYRTEQRTRQARFSKTMTRIIGLAMLTYFVINWVFLGSAAFAEVGYAQLSFVPILLLYSWAVDRPSYAINPWIDAVFFAAVQPGLYFSIDAMSASGASGWQFHAQMCYGLLLSLAFGCLAFAAVVLPFLLLSLASVGYLGGLLWLRGLDTSTIAYTLNSYLSFATLLFYVNWADDDKARRLFKARMALAVEREKSERLLENVLPAEIAGRLRADESVADDFRQVAVIFADIVGFTKLAKRLGSRRTVEMLNAYFSRADNGTDLFGLEKVKTIGDCYMAVSGALTTPPRPEKAAVDFSVFLVREAHRVGREFGLDLKVRVGINTGEVIGGVISSKRLSYDYWGDTINVAARLQGLAEEDGITVSEAIYHAVRDSYRFHVPRRVTLKNLGEADVYDIDLDAEAIV